MHFKRLLCVAILCTSSSVYSEENNPDSSSVSSDNVRAQYKNAILGMSLTEWRKLPFPEAAVPGTQTIGICSSFPKWTPSNFPLAISELEKASGVATCAYFTDRKIPGIFFGSQTITYRSTLSIGRMRNMESVDYYFYRDQLFRIVAEAELAAYADVLEGITARFGQPTLTSNGTVQNKAGATFEKLSAVWEVGPDTIILSAPGGGRVDKLTVIFQNKSLGSLVRAEVEKLNPAANKM